MEKEQYIYAYIYNAQGLHSPILKLKNDIQEISNFIIKTKNSPRIVMTDSLDNFILDTIYGFIDGCSDKKLLEKILKVLIPMQETEYGIQKQPGEIQILNSMDFGGDNHMRYFFKTKFNILI